MFQKINISEPLTRQFFGKFFVCTKWMIPNGTESVSYLGPMIWGKISAEINIKKVPGWYKREIKKRKHVELI